MGKNQQIARPHSRASRTSKGWLILQIILALMLMVAGAGVLLWPGLEADRSRVNGPNQSLLQQGQPAPDFSLPSLGGENVRLSDLAGQVVLVNLWATWCPPCKAEMPTLNAFYENHRQAGLVVLAVNHQEDAATVAAFIQAEGFSFPVLLDQQAEVMGLYQAQGLPTTFIIDRKGVIQHIQVGEIKADQLETIVGPLVQ